MSTRFQKFLSYYKPYLGFLAFDLFCAAVIAGVTLAFPLCIRYITKDVLTGDLSNAMGQIAGVGCVMLALVVVLAGCMYFVGYYGHVMGARMETDMRAELFSHYQKLSFKFYDENKTGQLMTRITNDLLSLTELYHHGPEDIVMYLVKFVGAFIILFQINPKLTLLIFAFLPFMFLYGKFFNKKMGVALRTNHDRIGDINAQVEDNLSGIRVVKSFSNEAVEIEKFNYENQRFLTSRNRSYQSETLFGDGLDILTQLVTVVLVLCGAASILNQTLDLADLLTFLLYIGNFFEPIKKMGHITMQYQEGFAGFNRYMDILEIDPDIRDVPNAVDLKQAKGHIAFRNVGFKYYEDHDYVLKNISLDIQAGEYVALVGTSGVGKTTLCSLIPRFYEVQEGQILIDGRDSKEVQLQSLRKNIGIVQQEVYLFAGTVLDNIAYGKPNASLEEIMDAAKKANAHEFIMGLPKGYQTDIGQRGVKLSGGQKQRLSIARVFLKNPPILIFDEATSALDNESEKAVKGSLEILAHNRTTIVIAHRLSTIRNAQRIIVLTDNGISEQGTHDELIQHNGVYAHLYTMQFDIDI